MLIFTEEIINANPGLRTYLFARPYLFDMDLNYEDGRTLEEFLEFNKYWLPCVFSESGDYDFEEILLKILRDIKQLPEDNLVVKDIRKIINTKYYNYTSLNKMTCFSLMHSCDEEDISDKFEMIDLLISFGAIPNQEDYKVTNYYENIIVKLRKKLNI